MKIDREKAKQAGYTDEEINAFETQQASQAQQQPTQSLGQQALGFLKGAANFVAPRTTEVVSNIATGKNQPYQTKDYLLSGLGPLGQMLGGSPAAQQASGAGGEIASYLIPTARGLQGSKLSAKLGLAGAVSGATGEGDILQKGQNAALQGGLGYLTGGTLEKVLPVLKYPSKSRAANVATKEAEKATKAGEGIHWDDLQEQIRERIKTKLGDNPKIRTITNRLLSEKTPAAVQPTIPEPGGPGSTAGSFLKSPSELLDWRRQIARRGGKTFFEQMFRSASLENKIEAEARSILTKEIHRMAPKTLSADKIYSFYSKPGNTDIPGWVKRIAVGYLARQGTNQVLGPQLSSLLGRSLTGGQ